MKIPGFSIMGIFSGLVCLEALIITDAHWTLVPQGFDFQQLSNWSTTLSLYVNVEDDQAGIVRQIPGTSSALRLSYHSLGRIKVQNHSGNVALEYFLVSPYNNRRVLQRVIEVGSSDIVNVNYHSVNVCFRQVPERRWLHHLTTFVRDLL